MKEEHMREKLGREDKTETKIRMQNKQINKQINKNLVLIYLNE